MPALQSRDFRLFWVGNVISVSGQQMYTMVQPWIIYELSGSKLLLGLSGLAQAIPATVLTLYGGVIADKVDQKKLLVVASLLQVLTLLTMAAISFTELLTPWLVMAGSFVFSAVSSFEGPARHAMFPHLTERRNIANAVALNATVHPGTRIGGPVVAGFLLAAVMDATTARVAAGVIYSLTAVGYLVMVSLLLRVRMPDVRRAHGGHVIADMAAAIRFIWRNRIFAALIGTAYFTQFFGHASQVMFPVFAKDILDVGPSGLGLMYTAMGIGSFTAAASHTNLGAARLQRSLLVGGAALGGMALFLFAISTWFIPSLLLLFLVGLGLSTLNVAVQTNLQLLVSDDFRGRVMGMWGMVHTSIRPLGEMQAGALAAVTSAPLALMVSGVAILAFMGVFIVPNRLLRNLGGIRVQAHGEAVQP